jgi:CMP-N-acetylneuraminic acid synthetase
MASLTVLGIIPARGGSKGVPRKNIRPLAGKPLLQYTAQAARAAKRLTRVILSTDDKEIADVGRQCGLESPFLRPAHLATDSTPTLAVIEHLLGWLKERGENYDAVCLLQPTTPLRRAQDIDACIELLETSGADAVVSVAPVPAEFNPHWVYFKDKAGFLKLSTGEPNPIPRRQDLPPAFHRDGSIYVTRRQVILEQHSLYGGRVAAYCVDPERTVNIDTLEDWERAEQLLRSLKL